MLHIVWTVVLMMHHNNDLIIIIWLISFESACGLVCVFLCVRLCLCVFVCAHINKRVRISCVSLLLMGHSKQSWPHVPWPVWEAHRGKMSTEQIERTPKLIRTELRFSTKKSNEYFIHRNGSCLSYFLLSVIATQPQKNVIVKCLLLINHEPCLDLALWSDDSSRQHVIHCALNWFIDEQPNVLFTSIPCFIKSLFSSAAYNSPLQRHIINQ